MYRSIHELKPYPRNARIHGPKQVDQIAASITAFGFNNPILIDDEDQIVAGHGRWLAAKELGLSHVPTILLSGMTKAQIALYRIADNRTAELAGWDPDILAIEFQHLNAFDLDIDLEVTGFEAPEIDNLLMGLDLSGNPIAAGKADPADQVPPVQDRAVSRSGDLWLLGNHRVLCESALDGAAYERLLDNKKARLVATDPPYNVSISGHVLRTTKHPEFAMASYTI